MHDLGNRGQLGPTLQGVLPDRVDAEELQVGRLVGLDSSRPVCPELRQGSHLHMRHSLSAQVIAIAPILLLGGLSAGLLLQTELS